jgi:uncharacterized protein DUF6456
MRVIISEPLRTNVVFYCPTDLPLWQAGGESKMGGTMARNGAPRLLHERSIEAGIASSNSSARLRPVRSVTVNSAESPLGWLLARGLVSRRQYDAGERLRSDWERSQLPPRVTMAWDSAPIARGRGGSAPQPDLNGAQIDARRRFHAAVDAAGPGLADILWRIVCAGEGMREAETALGWPARAGKLVLTLALDRIADHYRIR